MENKLLEALNKTKDRDFPTLESAFQEFSPREIFDAWLCYEGVSGYTYSILRALAALELLDADKSGGF